MNKYYKNTKSTQSDIIAYVIFALFVGAFIYLQWYLILSIYVVILIIIIIIRSHNEKMVSELILNKNTLTVVYSQRFRSKNVTFSLKDVSVIKEKNSVFKFSEVYNLKLYVGAEFKFLLKGEYEFASEDLLEIFNTLNLAQK